MNKNYRHLLGILLIWSASAVSEPLPVESRTMYWKAPSGAETSWEQSQWAEGTIKMPYINAADPGIAARINDMLYLGDRKDSCRNGQ